MSNIATLRADTPPALQMEETEILAVLRTSLYPGAKDQSIKMVLGYCKASGLDPMQKPVHIVPMWDKVAKEMRDVIMPGIGLYRTQAARSGELAGITEPEFGPDKIFKFDEFEFTAPEWCRVTVKRLVGSVEREFTAREYWIENYATAGKDSTAPNAMWKKRPRGQIAKCAQAQALRMAFPEMTGSQPTADEMEGKFDEIDGETGEVITAKKPTVAAPQSKSAAKAAAPAGEVSDAVVKGEGEAGTTAPPRAVDATAATAGEIAYISRKLTAHGVTPAQAREACGLDAGETLEGLTKDGFIAMRDTYK